MTTVNTISSMEQANQVLNAQQYNGRAVGPDHKLDRNAFYTDRLFSSAAADQKAFDDLREKAQNYINENTPSWLNPITWVSAIWNALGSMLGTIASCFGYGEKSENEGNEVGNG